MKDRIKMALLMGWVWREDPPLWTDPKGKFQFVTMRDRLPFDPENDANDCSALIIYLNRLGWIVRISIGPDAADVWIETLANECHDWSGDNWMHGVCKLALKVI